MKFLKRVLKLGCLTVFAIVTGLFIFLLLSSSAPSLKIQEAEAEMMVRYANDILETKTEFSKINIPPELTKIGIKDIRISTEGVFYCKKKSFVQEWGYFVPRDFHDFIQKNSNGKIQDGDRFFQLILNNVFSYYIAG